MKAKDLFLDFLNLSFLIVLVSFTIVYFIVGDRFAAFAELMRALVPISFFGIFYLVQLKISRMEAEKRREEDNMELTVYLNIFDKLLSELIVYLIPIILLVIDYTNAGMIDIIGIVKSAVVFIILFSWQKYIFSKTR